MIKAFVGHSFDEKDEILINKFTKFFDSLSAILEWDHARERQANSVSIKIKKLMEGKDVFIGIFTRKNKLGWFKNFFPSLWIIQESGYAIGKGMKYIFIIENGVEKSIMAGLHGDSEVVFFDQNNPEKSFSAVSEMLNVLYRELRSDNPKEEMEINSAQGSDDKPIEKKPQNRWLEIIKAIKDGDQMLAINRSIPNIIKVVF